MSPRTLIIAILSAATAFAGGYALLDAMQPPQSPSQELVTAVDSTPLPLVTGADGTLTIPLEAYVGSYGDEYVDAYADYDDDYDDDDHDDDKDHHKKSEKDHEKNSDKDHDKKESRERKSKHDDDDDHHDDHKEQTEVGSLVQGLITAAAGFGRAE